MKIKICIIGLGYVGLPLACGLAKKFNVTGYDINKKRINDLNQLIDTTHEVSAKQLKNKNLKFTSKRKDIIDPNFFIITVPTPVNKKNKPDLKPLISASKFVGKMIKKKSIVVYESTVYPGTTENICVPIIEKNSKLVRNKDFYFGYSPERINPGDKKHTLEKIKKVVSGSNDYSTEIINKVYKSVITAGTFVTKDIITAESAKIIENTQRDLNIAFMNELSMIFKKLNVNTYDVLEAAKTKWNFLNFKPGLVGGHCINVDPYYLTHLAEKIGIKPRVILSGRKINDQMANEVVTRVKKKLDEINKIKSKKYKNLLILGLTFKENCPDIRNSQVFKIIDYSKNYFNKIEVYDDHCNFFEIPNIYRENLIKKLSKSKKYNAIIIAVAHSTFKKIGSDKIKKMLKHRGVVFDVKRLFSDEQSFSSL